MKTMNMEISKEGIEWGKDRKDKDAVEVTVDMIKDVTFTFAGTSKKFTEEDRRQYYKVCDKFDVLLKERKDTDSVRTTIEFEDTEMGFIRKVFRENTGLLPTDYVRRVEENVMAVAHK